jgi:aminoglycoside phosphotransferase (APT) family kinase protein
VGECAQLVSDPGLAALSEIFDPAALAHHLRGVCLGRWNGGTVEEARVLRVLKHHAGQRCTLEIGWRGEGDWHFLIGKVYREDRPDIPAAMERIQQAGFGPQDEFSIPRPLAYLPSLHLFLQEKVEGRVAKEIFKTGDEGSRAAAAERCALWLARFHAFAPKAGPVFDSERCLSELRERKRRIAKLGGRLESKARRLFEWLEAAAVTLRPVEMRAGHASYSPAQLILAEGRTVTFDWDGYDVADPARDVARFLAALRRLAVGRLRSIRALDGPAEVFLRTYRAVGPPEVEHNLRFFMADACLTLVVYDLCRSGARWQEKGEALLDESLRIMDCEVPS